MNHNKLHPKFITGFTCACTGNTRYISYQEEHFYITRPIRPLFTAFVFGLSKKLAAKVTNILAITHNEATNFNIIMPY